MDFNESKILLILHSFSNNFIDAIISDKLLTYKCGSNFLIFDGINNSCSTSETHMNINILYIDGASIRCSKN